MDKPGHFAITTPCSTCSSSTFAPLLTRLSRYLSACNLDIGDSNDRNLLLAPEEELHRGHDYDRKSSKEDESPVSVFESRCVVC